MIGGQPSLEHLTGVPVQSTSEYRSCVHIQANADPKIMVSWPRCAPRVSGGGDPGGVFVEPAGAAVHHLGGADRPWFVGAVPQ